MCRRLLAAATSIDWTTEARQLAVLIGRTIPVVPRIEIPPSTPIRAFRVFSAIASPPGTEIVTSNPGVGPSVPATSATPSAIIRRGTGLIAAEPGGSSRPGWVIVPTPGPPRIEMPGSSTRRTVARTSAPWVTSGSSPPSLMTPAVADPSRTGQPVDRDHQVEPERRADRDHLGPLVEEQDPAGGLGRRGGAGPGGVPFARPLGVAGRDGQPPDDLEGRSIGPDASWPGLARPPASSSRALTAAGGHGGPPLAAQAGEVRARAICPTSRRLASSTPTNPTGIPTMQAGRHPSDSTSRSASSTAVGALPIATTAPSPTRAAPRRSPAAERVSPSSAARRSVSGRRARRRPTPRAARPGRGGSPPGASPRRSAPGPPPGTPRPPTSIAPGPNRAFGGEVEIGRGVDHPPDHRPLGRVDRLGPHLAVDHRQGLGHDPVARRRSGPEVAPAAGPALAA